MGLWCRRRNMSMHTHSMRTVFAHMTIGVNSIHHRTICPFAICCPAFIHLHERTMFLTWRRRSTLSPAASADSVMPSL